VQSAAHPVHVTVRAQAGLLRDRSLLPTLAGAVAAHRSDGSFKIVRFSLRDDQLHLIVETRSKRALSLAMRGLLIRIARRCNAALDRRGRFWADRYDARPLTSPRAVQAALRLMQPEAKSTKRVRVRHS